MLKRLLKSACILACIGLFTTEGLEAQSPSPINIECGDIVQGETSVDELFQVYRIIIPAGTTLNGRVEPLGSTFNVMLDFTDPAGNDFLKINDGPAGAIEQFSDLTVAQTNPLLAVVGYRPQETGGTSLRSLDYFADWMSYFGFYGAYRIYLGCVLPDGTVINPGERAPETSTTIDVPFSGVGFPGLAPKDFSDGVLIPFNVGVPNSGSITANFNSVFGFTLTGAADDVLALDFTRLSGNLNLGLAVLSPDNKIVFQASLVTSDTLSTRFTLPSAGEYTIGVYKIDLLPPASPENTAFQIMGTLNP